MNGIENSRFNVIQCIGNQKKKQNRNQFSLILPYEYYLINNSSTYDDQLPDIIHRPLTVKSIRFLHQA